MAGSRDRRTKPVSPLRRLGASLRRLAVFIPACIFILVTHTAHGPDPALAASDAPAVARAETLRVGSIERKYLLHVPTALRTGGPHPLVLVLHGGGGTGKMTEVKTGWSAKADREGFIVVYPEATSRRPEREGGFFTNPQVWNDGSGRYRAGRLDVDDVGFLRALIDHLIARTHADPKRVYVTGFSNGASMTYRLAAEAADRVAAAAPVAGHFWLSDTTEISRCVPTLVIAGMDDPLNPFLGGPARGNGIPRRILGTEDRPSMPESVRKWARVNGCDVKPLVETPSRGVKLYCFVSRMPGSEVLFYTVEGMGHVWPGAPNWGGRHTFGETTDLLDGTDVIWKYFVKNPMR